MATSTVPKTVSNIEEATVRFCGDSGDGMQLAGMQLASTSALARQRRRDVPGLSLAEIRAPKRHDWPV